MTAHLTSPDGTPASRFAFGTMQFGGRADKVASAAMYNACRQAGLNHFDTAWVYTDGQSEEILGDLIKEERDRLIIASKVGYSGGAGAANLQAQFDTSRKRLKLDCIDILYLHRFDAETPLQQILEWFAARKEAGEIRYLGLSNFAAWQVMKAQMLGVQFGLTADILQPMYSLVKRQAEVEILPMCTDQGIAIAPYSPLGGGLLTGKYAAGDGQGRLSEDERYNSRYGQDWMRQAAADLARLAQDHQVHPATLAVAWAAAHPANPMPIISARNAEQLAPSLAALEFDMDAELYAEISGLSPRPAPATDRLEEQE
ncbi:oxidoreductase, aldo/keto reductase family protein [Roseobacter sp. SK209-2-6]|uniref:aldo/keto reductase n=1 Tax=Roseobacter sp. SK209-2-6 TaxID=388739 RepID=UPI0000F3C46C|nr:aldo/keto reductase [Roseobacter sp. SK209-2-6]EBA18663.1 oxidoreductase, aldo/keto reductase family protein [Roseobacter sp. SK209-2-6]